MSDDDSRALAVRRIEYRLAVACGQTWRIEAGMLKSIAAYINEIAIYCSSPWGHELRSKYTGEQDLAPYINAEDLRRAIWDDFVERRDEGFDYYDWWKKSSKPPLTAKQKKLVADHLSLVRELATKIARGSNLVLPSELEGLGLTQLEALAREYHPSRKVEFGAYAKDHLRDSMLDYVRLNPPNWAVAIGGKEPSEPSLTAEQAKLVTEAQGVLQKTAKWIAKGNKELQSDLELLGLRVLEELAPKYDKTRGAKFSTYASYRLRGAMREYVKEHKSRTVAKGGAKEADTASRQYKVQRDVKTFDEPSNRRGPATQYLKDGTVKQFAASGKLATEYLNDGTIREFNSSGRELPSGDMAVINRLLMKLNRKQRAVDEGMMLSEPPLSRADLARQLGIKDVTQISRILRQAQRKMTKMLAESRQNPK